MWPKPYSEPMSALDHQELNTLTSIMWMNLVNSKSTAQRSGGLIPVYEQLGILMYYVSTITAMLENISLWLVI